MSKLDVMVRVSKKVDQHIEHHRLYEREPKSYILERLLGLEDDKRKRIYKE
jgi:hypothetical protein